MCYHKKRKQTGRTPIEKNGGHVYTQFNTIDYKGEIPIEKNVIVTDVNGKRVGLTYPKRARGLVKNGRAEYVSDCEIRLLFQQFESETAITHDPSVNKNTEDNTMSKVINFNAREFKFDSTCDSNVGSRMFVTDCSGQNKEIFEIGDWEWAWTQICCEKQLEKNTDYMFRFAMTGGYNDTCDGTSQFLIVPIENERLTPEDWENRYVYNLSQSQYKPTISKRWGNGMLRVYEIPFNTYDCEKFRFVFISQHVVTWIFPAQELTAYADFKDYSYSDWYNEKFGNRNNLKGYFRRSVNDFVNRTVNKALNSAFAQTGGEISGCGDGASAEYRNRNMTGSEMSSILRNMGDGSHIDLSNCNISDVDAFLECGRRSDGSNFKMTNTNMGGRAFCGVLRKIGDGCNIDFSNTNILYVEDQYAKAGNSADGCNIEMDSVTISAGAFSALMSKLGDGCVLDLSNSTIKADDTNIGFGSRVDGTVINLSYSKIPDSLYRRLNEKTGDGCCINENGLEIYYDGDRFQEVRQVYSEDEVLRRVAELMAVSGPSSAAYVQRKLGLDHTQTKNALDELVNRGVLSYLNGDNEYLSNISPDEVKNFFFGTDKAAENVKYPEKSYSYSVAGVILDIDLDFENNNYDVNAKFDDSDDGSDKQYGVNEVLEELKNDFAGLSYRNDKQKELCEAAFNDAKDSLNGILE